MIVFDLLCEESGDRFEAWFRSGADYEDQRERGLVRCPACQSKRIGKAPMAPRVPKKGAGEAAGLARLAALQTEMLRNSEWVGDRFADEARSIHSGDADPRPVHGNATPEQARSLIDDGVPIAPLPFPVTPPNQVN